MTEREFRHRFVQLWIGFTIGASVVSRVLLISGLGFETQGIIYQAIWLGTVVAAVVLYFKGSVTDRVEREQILSKARAESTSRWSLISAVILLGMLAAGLGFGLWESRYDISWEGMAGFLAGLGMNFGLMAVTFLCIRNAQLRRMQEREV
jgi:hypothetical protein